MIRRAVIIAFLVTILITAGAVFAREEQERPKMFVGEFTLDEVLEHDEQYADIAFIYVPDPEALAVFKAVSEPLTIKCFYRTDCVDSVREVPRFIKTIQLAENPNITVQMVGVNRGKDEPADLVAGWDLQRVPTFIVVVSDAEVGRVIETSKVSIDVDLAEILKPFAK